MLSEVLMEFKTQYDAHPRFFTNKGDPEHILYGGHYDDFGRVVLEETGRENIYDFIQSHADSVNIHLLLKRFQNGEMDVLSRVQGTYGDFTEFPKTYAEALNRMNECEQVFASLPVDVRAKFGHNFTQFLAESSSSDFLNKLGVKTEMIEESNIDISKPVEQEVIKE